MHYRPTPFEIDNDRFYYEPRALWSSGRVGASVQTRTQRQPAGYLHLPKEDFRNGSRYPIRITHAIVSPVGYLFATATSIEDPIKYDACMAALGRMKIRIAFPKRSWIERLDTNVMQFATEPAAEPGFSDDPTLSYSSGLLGISRWTFEPSYIVPRKVTMDLILSTLQGYTLESETPPVGSASLAFFERGGRMLGHARNRPSAELEYGPTWTVTGAWPETNSAVIGDAYASQIGISGPQGQTFPGKQKWPSNLYLHQLGSRGLPFTEVTGFAVAIDQIDIDDEVHASLNGVRVNNEVLAPVAQRIITKCATRDGGTQQRWWKDGAPLSLVTPTQNSSGFVHRFAQPFEIGPGEGLEVGLQAPPAREVGELTVNSVYNVGVSFLGYAVVEDNNEKIYR